MNKDLSKNENRMLADNELEEVVGGRDWSALIEFLIVRIPNDPRLPLLIDDVRHHRINKANQNLVRIEMSHPELSEDIKKFK